MIVIIFLHFFNYIELTSKIGIKNGPWIIIIKLIICNLDSLKILYDIIIYCNIGIYIYIEQHFISLNTHNTHEHDCKKYLIRYDLNDIINIV